MSSRDEPRRTVLIVDDEARVRSSLAGYLTDEGYRVLESKDPAEAEKVLAKHGATVDVILLDVRMPGEDGVAFLERREDITREHPVIMMSGHGTIELAVEAVRLGAFDFLEKGFTPERLGITVERALQMHSLRRQNLALKEEAGALHRLVGDSKPMEELRALITRAAPTPAKVLILGENGVGKELVARAIHDMSARLDGPFVRLNCAAIPRDLVESELFGHEKGAFTGADALKKGKLELAHGGTLFLDEIGDMNLEAQAKLLRALESNEFERVGGTKIHAFDARIIAATNQDLKKASTDGSFRQDLFYRLNVLPILVPALRDHAGDVAQLAEHYLGYFREEYGRPDMEITPPAMALLERHSWPGNVRELRNLMERLVIMTPSPVVGPEQVASLLGQEPGGTGMNMSLELDVDGDASEGLLKRMLEAAEREILQQELDRAAGNVSQAARTLGIDRANLHRKMRRLGIESRRSET